MEFQNVLRWKGPTRTLEVQLLLSCFQVWYEDGRRWAPRSLPTQPILGFWETRRTPGAALPEAEAARTAPVAAAVWLAEIAFRFRVSPSISNIPGYV